MNFTFNINVPANTLENSPVVQEMDLSEGVVYNFQVLSSTGTNGLVYCYVRDKYSNMVYPKNPNGVYKLWGTPIEGKYPACGFDLTGTNMKLYFVGYSPGSSYDHVITVSFWIIKKEDLPFLEKATKKEISGFLTGLKKEGKYV